MTCRNWIKPRTTNPILRELFSAMASHNISKERLADRIGYNEASITAWKHGRNQPSLPAVQDLAQALGYRLKLERVEA